MSAVATSAVVVVGPWVLLVALILLVVLVPSLVRLVLNKSIPTTGGRDVSIRVRLLLWLRIEIDVKTPGHVAGQDVRPPSGDPPSGEVVRLREDNKPLTCGDRDGAPTIHLDGSASA
jgi:hypothetical protein